MGQRESVSSSSGLDIYKSLHNLKGHNEHPLKQICQAFFTTPHHLENHWSKDSPPLSLLFIFRTHLLLSVLLFWTFKPPSILHHWIFFFNTLLWPVMTQATILEFSATEPSCCTSLGPCTMWVSLFLPFLFWIVFFHLFFFFLKLPI